MTTNNDTLAIHGGNPIRTEPMPWRKAFGQGELDALVAAVHFYWDQQQDPPYEGHFKTTYAAAFSDFMGGGHTISVSSGPVES